LKRHELSSAIRLTRRKEPWNGIVESFVSFLLAGAATDGAATATGVDFDSPVDERLFVGAAAATIVSFSPLLMFRAPSVAYAR
jgi:hypothetical protein